MDLPQEFKVYLKRENILREPENEDLENFFDLTSYASINHPDAELKDIYLRWKLSRFKSRVQPTASSTTSTIPDQKNTIAVNPLPRQTKESHQDIELSLIEPLDWNPIEHIIPTFEKFMQQTQISTPQQPPPPPTIEISNPTTSNEITKPTPHRGKGSMEEIANALKKGTYDKGIKRLKTKTKNLILERNSSQQLTATTQPQPPPPLPQPPREAKAKGRSKKETKIEELNNILGMTNAVTIRRLILSKPSGERVARDIHTNHGEDILVSSEEHFAMFSYINNLYVEHIESVRKAKAGIVQLNAIEKNILSLSKALYDNDTKRI